VHLFGPVPKPLDGARAFSASSPICYNSRNSNPPAGNSLVFLAEPPPTAYDFRFQLFGIPIRVTPFFWLVSAFLGWQLADGLDEFMQQVADMGERVDFDLARIAASNPGQGVLLLMWIAAVFVSILVHELGHALAMRRYGISSYIVLYHFGGLAVPDRGGSFVRSGAFAHPPHQIAISAAGPAAQLLLAGVLITALRLSGFALLEPLDVPYVSRFLSISEGQQITSLPLQAVIYFLLIPSIFWALLNLLPVYPLDGGQIARELFTLYSPRDGIRNSLILSVAAGAGVAIYAFLQQDLFLALLFGSLAFSSYQVLQAYSGRGGGFGGPW